MAIPRGPAPQFTPTVGLHSGTALNRLSDMLGSSVNNITAFAGGGKASATPITGVNAVISVCATGADSVLLPLGYVGLTVVIQNAGAASAQVFGTNTDTIQGVATGTGVALANGATAMYRCVNVTAAGVGQWVRFVSA